MPEFLTCCINVPINAGACFNIFFALVYKEGNYSVTGDVNAGTRHIKDTVDTGDKAEPSSGRPTAVKIMVSMMKPAPGTPAVPIDASVPVSTMVSIWQS